MYSLPTFLITSYMEILNFGKCRIRYLTKVKYNKTFVSK